MLVIKRRVPVNMTGLLPVTVNFDLIGGEGVISIDKDEKLQFERQPRVKLIPLHRVSLTLKKDGQDHIAGIANLSSGGIGVISSSFSVVPDLNEILSCVLHIEKLKISTKIKVRHISQEVFGCLIIDNVEEFEKIINEYFKKELMAVVMSEVAETSVKQGPKGKTRWWNGGEFCDLLVVTDAGLVLQYDLIFFGNIITGSSKTMIGVGQIMEAAGRFRRYDGSSIINYCPKITQEMSESLIKFVHNIQSLDIEICNQICATLQV